MTILQGYGSVFARIIRTSAKPAFVVASGGFMLAGFCAGLHVDHDGPRFASTLNGTLRLWQDAYGLAFECDVDDDLAEEVRSGRRMEASCTYVPIATSSGTFGGEAVEYFKRTTIDELSLVPVGGCPDTAVWTAATPDWQMTERQRFSARMWRMGKAFNERRDIGRAPVAKVAAGLSSSGQPPRPAVPQSLARLMSQPWWDDYMAIHHAAVRFMEAHR